MKTWSTEDLKPEDIAPEGGDHEEGHDCEGHDPDAEIDGEVVLDFGTESY